MTDIRSHAYPVAILQDRYGGTYSGGAWLAIANYDEHQDELGPGWSLSRFDGVVSITHGEDCTAADFICPSWVGLGRTPDEALSDLYRKMGEK